VATPRPPLKEGPTKLPSERTSKDKPLEDPEPLAEQPARRREPEAG
jgi:hypothetical protein